ncbi:hypothetical protein R6Q59_010700 [Mikania micrantha]|uniref:Uncharacterized protein n=1 Tax=Mikania micrantha TaxID=192012 RepID=A0A5N6N4F1_9ASTR|nr:hypothetical protein E3N88_25317 [Mikania micrantha]
MEVTGVVFHQSPCFSPATAESRIRPSFPTMKKPKSFRPISQLNRKSFAGCVVSDEFSDKSHLQYYYEPVMAVGEIGLKKKDVKKKLKLLKGLSKNLSDFSEMGFCLNLDNGLDQQVKGQMISEATDVLVKQLQKLKEEKMESKKMKKDKKKASQMMMVDSSSSSSESSSSESDCNNVVNMSQLETMATSTSTAEKPEINAISIVNEDCGKKIEVCMGGKCKKSGAAMLLENFRAAVAGEAEVVGCKCMGKCRDGPNVMVRREEVAPAPAVANSLCIGVGLEDVDRIVSNFFGSCSEMVPAL